MAKIVWLVSYPKSGNTWMRILLANYLRNPSAPIDINKLHMGGYSGARSWFDEWVGVEASALTDTVIERLRPDVYRCMALEELDPIYMKVHDAWGVTDRGVGLFPADITGGVVYILRNPLDMVASCSNHWGVDLEKSVIDLCNPSHALARSIGGMADQLKQKLGSWSGHVKSWVDESGFSVHLVRYEDLKIDPVGIFSQVVHYCGLPYDAERVQRSVLFSDFTELQRQEKVNDFCERSPKARGGFFRKGESGTWREELPVNLVRRIIDVQGETMERFGYLDDNGQPV